MKEISVALAGNPNAGKSSIFNALTGSHQHVGNWPGKTVEKKEGFFHHDGVKIKVVDLPGTYSLTAFSPEEVIARDYIIHEKPDVVVTVLDSSNLERNLYLAVQVLELGCPVIAVLNMTDISESRGIKINHEKLSTALQSPVVHTVASKGEGIPILVNAILNSIKKQNSMSSANYIALPLFKIDYGNEAEEEISHLVELINNSPTVAKMFPARWLAIKLLEMDEDIQMRLRVLKGGAALLDESQKSISHLEAFYGDEVDVAIADRRYGWINGLVREIVQRPNEERLMLSDKIDRIVTHRLLGIPIFLAAMWLVFKLTTDVSAPYLEWVDGIINGPIARWIVSLLGIIGLGGTWVESLMIDGVIAGVGGVLVFVPVLLFLYLALAILEDTGYMARAAFVMDRLMHYLGLHGKSFLPMLIGFGCTVPAIYATRTLENKKDRILTGLLVPFMSCGARLPVYILFTAIFFPNNAGFVVFSLYLLGILTAIVLGVLLKNTIFKGKTQSTFVMELPPYRLPTLRSIWIHTWERTGSFLRKAWTVIMAVSVILWLLMAIPIGGQGVFADTDVNNSVFAAVNKEISPVFKPLGFGSWEASSALVTGFVAKEVVISTMSQVYAVEEVEQVAEVTPTFFEDVGEVFSSFVIATFDTLKSIPLIVGISMFEEEPEEESTALMMSIQNGFETSSNGHTTLAALGFMVFVLIYTPCMVAIAAERQELGMNWTWLSIIGQFMLAWLMAFIIFQGGQLLGFG